MAESSVNAYATNSSNQAATSPTPVAVINDGTGDRQVVVLGSGDGTTGIQDGSSAHPVRTDPTGSTTQPVSGTVAVSNLPATQPVSGSVSVSNLPATQPVSAASLPLPSGASTAAKQDTGNTSLASIDGKITAVNTGAVTVSSSALPTGAATAAKQPAVGTAGTPSADVISVQGEASMTPLKVDPSGVTSPVSAASLPLPSGAATSALQTTANTSLSSIDAGIPTALGQTTKSASMPVTLASDTGTLPVQDSAAESSLSTIATNTGSSATSANQTNGSQRTGSSSAAVNVGQQTVNTTAVQTSITSTVPTNGILIGALSTNSASIFIGGSSVTTSTGAELTPGSSLPFTCNLNTLYIISAASTSDKIWYSVT